MKKFLYILSFICFSTANVCLAGVWSEKLTVNEIFTEDSNIIVAYTSGGGVYTEGCSANKWVFTSENDSRMNRVYSTLLAALSSGKSIKIYTRDTCSSWNFHGIYAVKIIK